MNAAQRKQIESLYLEMFNKLIVYARSCLENEALAEEAVQETFHIACQKPEELCGCGNPQGWLVLTLRNTIRNIRSNQATARRILEQYMPTQFLDTAVSEDPLNLQLLYGDIADTEEFRLLYELAIEGRSHQEMAKARGISVDACKKRVQRAKEKLKKLLIQMSPNGDPDTYTVERRKQNVRESKPCES